MSAPPPLTVKTPLEYDADPAIAGLPTSASAHGDGSGLELPAVTLTLSKVAVFSAPALCAQLNRPIVTGSVSEIVVVPTGVQVLPSAEEKAVMMLPVRVSLSHTSARCSSRPTRWY